MGVTPLLVTACARPVSAALMATVRFATAQPRAPDRSEPADAGPARSGLVGLRETLWVSAAVFAVAALAIVCSALRGARGPERPGG
ncbi:hypothetical protein GCM10027061_05420 [Nesterenkonia suensis]